MKKLLVLMCLMIPLFGQQSETDKEITEQERREIRQNLAQEKMNKHSWAQRTWMGVQDAEWKKFESAHRRAHQKLNEHPGKKVRKSRGHKILSYVIVGGVSFWVGSEYAKKSHRKEKRPLGWYTRGDKK